MNSRIVAFVSLSLLASSLASLRAGVSQVDCTLPLGTPLAGYNHGDRRVPHWPIPERKKYTTFMMPSVGVLDALYCRAVVIDTGDERIAMVSFDGIGADGGLMKRAFDIASSRGFSVPLEKVTFHASHSHSGPGAVSKEKLWELAPATDLYVESLQAELATSLADAMLFAESSMKDAVIGLGDGLVTDVTRNRRAGMSPYLTPDSIDPHMGIIRIDDAKTKEPIATIWNFAIHGTCHGPSNMKFSADIMGAANRHAEEKIGGVAFFINADAGDIDPKPELCVVKDGDLVGGPVIADHIASIRDTVVPQTHLTINATSHVVDFGRTDLNLTLARVAGCTKGGFLDVCSICNWLHCDANLHLDGNWVEDQPRFTALSFDDGSKRTVAVTFPGEALYDLGKNVRATLLNSNWDRVFLFGYTNNHMGYFATPTEYDLGGYESELTFWGVKTASMIENGALQAASTVA